ncbi:hypothetical protein COW46_02705 [Candidatus Gracilibacteria bacterium CG17_big_fil_post_rev_8_21_14_2_50_48_13]|nr:MAG: hypothetical protein COW46_02705 [Candidatus Gracilibacteria bacterium CG17_big_fil_post_rev_8_21_14_2_50_48_13]
MASHNIPRFLEKYNTVSNTRGFLQGKVRPKQQACHRNDEHTEGLFGSETSDQKTCQKSKHQKKDTFGSCRHNPQKECSKKESMLWMVPKIAQLLGGNDKQESNCDPCKGYIWVRKQGVASEHGPDAKKTLCQS